jgi:uncharacterized membrane protein YbhN (UPF0104 family)
LTGGALYWLVTRADAARVRESLLRIPGEALLAAIATFAAAVAVGTVRWRLLFRAYGARSLPRARDIARWYLAGFFYNLLPGAVGGDLLRGYWARAHFADTRSSGTIRSVSVVLVERVLGLAGLLICTALAASMRPAAPPEIVAYSVAGLLAAILGLAALAQVQRLTRFLPARLLKFVPAIPSLVHWPSFLTAVALSVLANALVAVTGHVLISGIAPHVSWLDSMMIFSVGTMASFFPLTVAGTGARETALVMLFAKVGVSEPDALASSFALLFCNVVLAAVGGLLQRPSVQREPLKEESLPAASEQRA